MDTFGLFGPRRRVITGATAGAGRGTYACTAFNASSTAARSVVGSSRNNATSLRVGESEAFGMSAPYARNRTRFANARICSPLLPWMYSGYFPSASFGTSFW